MASYWALVVLHSAVPQLCNLAYVSWFYRRAIATVTFVHFALMILTVARCFRLLLWIIADYQLALVNLWPLVVGLLTVVIKIIVKGRIVMVGSLVMIPSVGIFILRLLLLIWPAQNFLVRFSFEMIKNRRWLFDLWEDRHLGRWQCLRFYDIFGKGWRGIMYVIALFLMTVVGEALVICVILWSLFRWCCCCCWCLLSIHKGIIGRRLSLCDISMRSHWVLVSINSIALLGIH